MTLDGGLVDDSTLCRLFRVSSYNNMELALEVLVAGELLRLLRMTSGDDRQLALI